MSITGIKTHLKETNIDNDELDRIIYKLVKDGYIEPVVGLNLIITFEGKLFHGYIEQNRINQIRDRYLETAERIRTRNERYVAQGSILVAVGTLCLFFWEVGKFVFPLFWHFLHYLLCFYR